MTQPVFLVAARRSGTTLFRLMLEGHPDVVWHRGWERVVRATDKLISSSAVEQTVQVGNFDPVTAKTIAELRNGLEMEVDKALLSAEKKVFGATVHVDFKDLLDIWPNAKFIHLIRDPRDVAISFLKLGWAKHYFDAADGWEKEERDWDEMTASLQGDQYINLRYEELVADPEEELKRVCAFLQIDYSDKLFSYIETSTYSLPKKSLAFRWKKQLNERETRQVESGRHPIMKSKSYSPAFEDTSYSKVQVFLFNLVGTWRLRRKRIAQEGILYVVIGKIARDLNIRFLSIWIDEVAKNRRQKRLAQLEKDY